MRTPEELEALARAAFEQNMATLQAAGITPNATLLREIAIRAGEKQVQLDLEAMQESVPQAPQEEKTSWFGRLFGR